MPGTIQSFCPCMKAVTFYIACFFIYLFALIPFPIVFIVSDVCFLLLYYIAGYRKKVVMENLRNSFPEKSEADLKRIARRFYRHLCDLFIETFKNLTMSKATALRHAYLHPEAIALFERYNNEKRSIILVLGHYGNWEWAANAFNLKARQQLCIIYHQLSNPYFDKLMHHIRSRYGSRLYTMQHALREMINNKDKISATAFVADQTPPPEGAYWTTFLNQDTPVFRGTEKIAQKLDLPVVYISNIKKKRGVYEMRAKVLTDYPKDTAPGEISEMHTRELETEIREHPEYWLWSHRRWKHKRVND